MRALTLTATGLVGAVSWLTLLVATDFSGPVVGIGLLAVLYVTGRWA